MNEIRAPYHRDEIGLRWRAIPVAHGAYPHTGAALALLTRVHGPLEVAGTGALVAVRRIRQTNHCEFWIGSFHISWKIQESPHPVN